MSELTFKGQSATNVVAALVIVSLLFVIATVTVVQTGGRYSELDAAHRQLKRKHGTVTARLNHRIAELESERDALLMRERLRAQEAE